MLKRNKKSNCSQIRKEEEWKVVLKQQASYVGALIAFYGVFFLLIVSDVYSAIARFIWGMDTRMYWFIIDTFSWWFIVLPIVFFIIVEIRMVISKEKTINQLVMAIEGVYNKEVEEVQLPPNLEGVQDQLSRIRLQQKIDEQRAKEAEQRKNDLIVYLAHDLKTPLTSIIGYLTLLNEEEKINQKLQKKYQGIVLEKAYRLENLINEFFEITRYNLQTMELEKTKLDISLLLSQLSEEFYPILKEKNQELICDLPEGIFLDIDGAKMARVFDNLLKNATVYGIENSEIHLKVENKEEELIIRVMNEGPCIPAHKLQLIFDKFYRLDESRSSKTGGSGLGLAVAKRIVELHQGTIVAESSDKETSFIVSLQKI